MTVRVRRATPADTDRIVELIYDLAEYEKLRDRCTVTSDQLGRSLFGPTPAVFAHVAEEDGGGGTDVGAARVVGIAVWFLTYSTWDGVHGIHLEDLFVAPDHRGGGAGTALLAELARECVDKGWTRLAWDVLDWNEPSIAFYDSLGARPSTEWIGYRLTDEPLRQLANYRG